MNATWNSEPLFTAFACSEDDEDLIAETVEDGVTVIRAESEDNDQTNDTEVETIELGNVIRFDSGDCRQVPGLRRSSQLSDRCWTMHLAAADRFSSPDLGAPTARWITNHRMPVARGLAQQSAGTPLFLAA